MKKLTTIERILSLLAIILLGLCIYINSKPEDSKSPIRQEITRPTVTYLKQELLELHNIERELAGLEPLEIDERLNRSAKNKCLDMTDSTPYWEHNSPSGITPWAYIENEHFDYSKAGENLAKDYQTNKEIMEAWMVSQTHRDNVLGDFKYIGIAKCENVTVIHFGKL